MSARLPHTAKARPKHSSGGNYGRPVLLRDVGRAGDVAALSHYADPAYYSKTYKTRRRDIEYYRALALGSKGPVLEYGIGNGRIALPIARAGISVVGIDLSAAMLADLELRLEREAADVRARLHLVRGDMRRVRLRRRFPLVIAPFNAFLHLYERRDVEQFLARVREHLAPHGRFVFDISVPRGEDISRDPKKSFGAPRLRHPTTGELTRYRERFEYDPVRQLLLVTMEFRPEGAGRPFTVPLTHRQFFPRELEALLHYNGFTKLVWSADFTARAPDLGVDSLVVSCRASGAKRPARALPLARAARRV